MLQSGFQFSDPSAPLFMVYGGEIPIFLAIGAALAQSRAVSQSSTS